MGSASDDDAVAALHKAISHRMRRHILLVMEEDGQPLAPTDYERRFLAGDKKEVSQVSYHFKVLNKWGLIELAGTELVRGSVKHLYRLSPAFTADLRDTLALDQIAELLGREGVENATDAVKKVIEIVVATGRCIQ